jgi:hypothetical protein
MITTRGEPPEEGLYMFANSLRDWRKFIESKGGNRNQALYQYGVFAPKGRNAALRKDGNVSEQHHQHSGDHGHHTHGPNCGHKAVKHDGHTDYLHDGHLHHQHGEHVEDHRIEVSSTNPEHCTPAHECTGHGKKHVHGPNCGHEAVPHGSHVDYLVDGHLHHHHGSHCDDHGVLHAAGSAGA